MTMVVEAQAEERVAVVAVADQAPASEDEVLSSLQGLRSKAAQFVQGSQDASRSHQTTSNQLRASFMTEVLPWGKVLMEAANTPLRCRLFEGHGLAHTEDPQKAWQNIFFLAMAKKNSDGGWYVPARRHERLGAQAFYIASNPEAYPPGAITEKLAVWGAFSKLDAAMKPTLSSAESDALRTRRSTVYQHDAKDRLVKLPGLEPEDRKFGLALVTLHRGGVKLLNLVKGQDKLADRLADRYCVERIADLNAELLASMAEQDAE